MTDIEEQIISDKAYIHVTQQVGNLPVEKLVELHNYCRDSDDDDLIFLLTTDSADALFDSPWQAFQAIRDSKEPIEIGDYVKYDANTSKLSRFTKQAIFAFHLHQLADKLISNGQNFASQYGISLEEEKWEAYDALHFLQKNLESLTQQQLSEIASEYFVSTSNNIKLSDEYIGMVLVKQTSETK